MGRVRASAALALAAVVSGCTFLTSLDGLSGPASARDDAAAEGSAREASGSESGVDDDAGLPDANPAASKRVYLAVVGGAGSNGAVGDVQVAEVLPQGDLGPWKVVPSLPQGYQRGSVVGAGNHAFVLGGDGTSGFSASTYGTSVAGPAVSGWVEGPALPSARFRHGAAVSNGRVFVVGGSVASPASISEVLAADVLGTSTLGAWEAATSLPEGRSSAVVVASRGYLYVLTGSRNVPGAPNTGAGWVSKVSATGALGAWRDVLPLDVTTNAGAGAATEAHVYVSGGFASGTYDYVRGAAIQADGTLGGWFEAGIMNTGRAGHAVAVARGRLYAIGGLDSSDKRVATIEVADVLGDGTLSKFRMTASLPQPLAFHGVAVLTEP